MNQIYITWDATNFGIRNAELIKETTKNLGAYVKFEAGKEEWIPNECWFKTLKGAIRSAERQRKAKIVQLEAQIKRLQEMEFK